MGIEIGQCFYEAALKASQNQLEDLQSFQIKLEQLRAGFEVQSDSLETEYERTHTFKNYVLPWDTIDDIYQHHITDLKHESTQLFHPSRAPLTTWLTKIPEEIKALLTRYVTERFHEYWTRNGITELLVRNGRPSRTEVEKELRWLVGKPSKSFWRYYGETKGTVHVYIGVGNRQEESALLSAFRGLAGALGADPSFYDTGDNHAITCITFRHGIPLYLLASTKESRELYQREVTDTATLHINAELAEQLRNYNLFPQGSKPYD